MSGEYPCRLIRFQFRQLPFHLDDQHRQLFLALLTGVGVDVASVLFAVDPLGQVATLPQVVVDFADAARSQSAMGRTVRCEGYGRSGFLTFRFFLHLRPGDALVDVPGRVPLHLVGNMGVDVSVLWQTKRGR